MPRHGHTARVDELGLVAAHYYYRDVISIAQTLNAYVKNGHARR